MSPSRQTLLFVVHIGGGGTPQTTRDLAFGLEGFKVIIWEGNAQKVRLTSIENSLQVGFKEVEFHADRIVLGEATNAEFLDFFEKFLIDEEVTLVHFRHVARQPMEMLSVAATAQVPFLVSLHDFYFVCPSTHLIDGEGRFCAGKCSVGKRDCQPRMGVKPLTRLRDNWVYSWRDKVGDKLKDAAGFVVTNPSVWAITARQIPAIADKPHWVIEHGRDIAKSAASNPGYAPVNVLTLGNIGGSKGLDTINDCVRYFQGRLSFHHFGELGGEYLGEHHGPYSRDSVGRLIASLKPAIGLIPSRMFETYSHVLTEFWSQGVAVVASRLGALQERINRHGGGLLADSESPEAFYSALKRLADSPVLFRRLSEEATSFKPRSTRQMALDYTAVYEGILNK